MTDSEKVRRVIFIPSEIDEWAVGEAKKEVRSPNNFYAKLAIDAKRESDNRGATTHE